MSTSYEDYRRAVGQPVTLEFSPGEAIGGVLTECTELQVRGGWQSFTLTITASGPSSQATATMTLPGSPPTAIFLVPVSQRDDLVEYEAIFTQPEEG